jgi:hypothetical protein
MSAVLLVTNYQMKDFYDLFICFLDGEIWMVLWCGQV